MVAITITLDEKKLKHASDTLNKIVSQPEFQQILMRIMPAPKIPRRRTRRRKSKRVRNATEFVRDRSRG